MKRFERSVSKDDFFLGKFSQECFRNLDSHTELNFEVLLYDYISTLAIRKSSFYFP